MTQEEISRAVFLLLLFLFLLVRAFFTFAVRRNRGRQKQDVSSKSSESRVSLLIRRLLLTPLLALSLLLYFTNNKWLGQFALSDPRPAMYLGAALGCIGMALLVWVHIHLGYEWSAALRLHADHRLVQSGPYASIRHPMYTALFLVYFSLGLISANYIVLIVLSLIIISIALRIPDEERLLIDRFGDEYRNYAGRTGMFLPKF